MRSRYRTRRQCSLSSRRIYEMCQAKAKATDAIFTAYLVSQMTRQGARVSIHWPIFFTLAKPPVSKSFGMSHIRMAIALQVSEREIEP
jgi:hypothetical protein